MGVAVPACGRNLSWGCQFESILFLKSSTIRGTAGRKGVGCTGRERPQSETTPIKSCTRTNGRTKRPRGSKKRGVSLAAAGPTDGRTDTCCNLGERHQILNALTVSTFLFGRRANWAKGLNSSVRRDFNYPFRGGAGIANAGRSINRSMMRQKLSRARSHASNTLYGAFFAPIFCLPIVLN